VQGTVLCDVIRSRDSLSTTFLQVSHLPIRDWKSKKKPTNNKKKDQVAVDEPLSEQQFRKLYIPFLCEKSEAIALVLLGLMAGCLAGWLSSRLAGRQNSAKFRNFKIIIIPDEIFNFSLCLTKVQCYYSHINAF